MSKRQQQQQQQQQHCSSLFRKRQQYSWGGEGRARGTFQPIWIWTEVCAGGSSRWRQICKYAGSVRFDSSSSLDSKGKSSHWRGGKRYVSTDFNLNRSVHFDSSSSFDSRGRGKSSHCRGRGVHSNNFKLICRKLVNFQQSNPNSLVACVQGSMIGSLHLGHWWVEKHPLVTGGPRVHIDSHT